MNWWKTATLAFAAVAVFEAWKLSEAGQSEELSADRFHECAMRLGIACWTLDSCPKDPAHCVVEAGTCPR